MGKISLQEQTFIDLKLKHSTINVPTPFVYCTYRGKPYPEGATQIIYNIQSKMTEMCKDQLNLDFVEFTNSEEYYEYGNAIAELIVELEKKDMENVKLPQKLKEIANKSEHDMSVFVFNVANPRTKAQNAAQFVGAVPLTRPICHRPYPLQSIYYGAKNGTSCAEKKTDTNFKFE